MTQLEHPIFPLLNEINIAAEKGLPLLAISMTVALPDICVSLISKDGRTDSRRYKEWCDNNLGTEFSYVTSNDLYSMRCGVLHNGRFGDLKHEVGRVIFALDGAEMVNCKFNDAYIYSAPNFCRNFTVAVHNWIQENYENSIFKENTKRLIQFHPNGLAPYLIGPTVIA
ncbi:MAG: hypothetical protein AAF668_01365 [Pseudomonadota bacterium]